MRLVIARDLEIGKLANPTPISTHIRQLYANLG
jgi:hypothetical protein